MDAVDVLRTDGVRVHGALADADRLPKLDASYTDGDRFEVCGTEVLVFDVSGHTNGHIAFYTPEAQALFSADSLMGLGCGRLFEGTPHQMWASLLKLRALPPETPVCSGHEYTVAHARFAITVDPTNAALTARKSEVDAKRARGEPTVPSSLRTEIETNPFLRADQPAVAEADGLAGQDPEVVFAEVRKRKDNF